MSESDDGHHDRRDDSDQEADNGRKRGSNGRRQRPSGDARKAPPPSPAKLARRACSELADLIGREVQGIVSLERTDNGWCFGVEVLETARIPDTADVLAEYEVNADRRGRLVGYHRVRRYTRGSTRDQ
jgi:gas vesicle protein GvpO